MSIKEKVIALGFFDGVHLGPRRPAAPHGGGGCRPGRYPGRYSPSTARPRRSSPASPVPSSTPRRTAGASFAGLYGIDEVLMVPFDHEMMTTPWDDFVRDILIRRYHAVHLVAGHDHHFGHKNEGSPEGLQALCAQLGLGCDIIPKVEVAGITVSSTYIRRLVELGQIDRPTAFWAIPTP